MSKSSKQNPLLPVYLIVGENELKRDAVMARLRERAAAMGDLSLNSDVFDGAEATGTEIVAACNTMPFASEIRLVEVRQAHALKEADLSAVAEYVAKPSSTTVLALVAQKMAKNRRIYKAVAALGKDAIIECIPPKRYELPKTVRSMAVACGFTMTDAAARLLVDLVGEDAVKLDSEVRKLALAHTGKSPLDHREVAALVKRSTQAKPWEFVDAFARRDAAACVRLLPRLGDASPSYILNLCVARLRELVCAQSCMRRGSVQDIARELELPDWRVKNHAAWARSFTVAELRRGLVSACEAERAMKSGADASDVLLRWVLSVVARA